MSLATRHRPKDWEGFRGNSGAIRAIEALIEKPDKKRPHSFLLVGGSGTGKTTAARIILRQLGCADSDMTELDSADFRGIDTIRELRQQVQYTPMNGKARGWLLDECHQLTKDAQEALLKLLEEPPDHAYFVLCTTEPMKLKKTLKRRCVEFELKSLNEDTLRQLLVDVSREEGTNVPTDVLDQIVTDSLGSAGVALSVLEAIIELPVQKMMRAAKQRVEIEQEAIGLVRALVKGAKWTEIARMLKRLAEEPEQVRRLVLAYCSTVLLANDNPKMYVIMDAFRNPFYEDPKAKLVMACYEVCNA